MHLSLPSDKSVELAFKVGIAGTSSAPQSVSIVLERDAAALSFAANKSGEEWIAIINNPGSMFGLGQVNLSVNVVLNNRLFVPMKSTAEIVSTIVPQTSQEVMPKVDEPVEPAIAPLPQQAEAVKPKIGSLLQASEAAVVKAAPIQRNPEVKSAPAKIPKIETPLPKKVEETVKIVEPIKLQLLKSVEPGAAKSHSIKLEETKVLPKTSLFRLKKTKIVFK